MDVGGAGMQFRINVVRISKENALGLNPIVGRVGCGQFQTLRTLLDFSIILILSSPNEIVSQRLLCGRRGMLPISYG